MVEQSQSSTFKPWPKWMRAVATTITESFQAKQNPARGYLGGEICYVSPPLRTLNLNERFLELPSNIRERANQIIESEEVLRRYAARAIEQAWTIRPSRVQCLISNTERDLEKSTLDWFEDDWFAEKDQYCRETLSDKPDSTATRSQIRLLPVVAELVRNCTTHRNAVIFFEEDGMVGLAPVGTRVGDVVCRLEGLDVVGILREHGEDLWMIARVMELTPLVEINRSCSEVVFEVDDGHMKVLTRMQSEVA
jgi:hypothetical protein